MTLMKKNVSSKSALLLSAVSYATAYTIVKLSDNELTAAAFAMFGFFMLAFGIIGIFRERKQ